MRVTLQISIIVAVATLLMVTVFVIVGYTYHKNSGAILTLSEDLVDQVTETVIERTDNYLAPAAIMAQISAHLPDFDPDKLVGNTPLETYGIELLRRHPQLNGFFIGNVGGDFFFVKRFAGQGVGTQTIDRTGDLPRRTWVYRDTKGNETGREITEKVEYDPRQRPWFQGAVERNGLHWTDVYIFFTDRKPGITAAFPITDSSGAVTAVIGADVMLDELSSFLGRQEIGQRGKAFIVDQKGMVIAYPDLPLSIEVAGKPSLAHLNDLNTGAASVAFNRYQVNQLERFAFEFGKERFMASFTAFPLELDRPWIIGVVVPEDDFIGSIKRTNEVSLIISLLILMAAMLLAVIIARSISKPIVGLTQETRRITNFELEGDIELDSHITEVRDLGEAIQAMKVGLRSFKRYVPDELVRQLIDTGAVARLGGQERDLTILFTDVVEFTGIAERVPAEQLMDQLSEYLGLLVNLIQNQKGTVDKFMGDGLMAFWGAPVRRKDHAKRACLAALQCQQACDALNQRWQADGKPIFETRMGIYTGSALVGNVGSEERMNYTVLGDAVNVASRPGRCKQGL